MEVPTTPTTNGEKLLQSYQPSPHKCPTMKTPKILHSENNELETVEVKNHLNEVREFLGRPIVEKTCNLSQAQWIPELKCAKVLKKVGKKWNHFGHSFMGNDVIYPEEAAYLLEINDLEITHAGVPLSLQKCFSLLLTDENGCNLLEYRVFAHFVTFGYRVFRHDPQRVSDEKDDCRAKLTEIQEPSEEYKATNVKVDSNNEKFETRFTLDLMKDDQSWKGLSEKLYCHSENASNIEPTSTQTQPIHTIDSSSSSSEEESEDDEDSRSSSSDSDIMIIDSDKEKQAKPNEKSKSIEILTLDSSEDEGKSHKQILTGTKTTLKKENTSNVLEDFIPFKRFKNEESDEDIPKPSNRRRNKRNLKISKNIFRPDVNQDVPQGIENVSRGIEQPGNDLQVSNDLVEANISQFVQGAVEQLSQAMSMNLQGLNQGINNRGRGGGHRGHYERNWGQSQSFTPQNQHFVPGPQTNTNFGTFFNENHSMGNLPQVNTFGSVTPFGTSLPPTNIMDGTQSSVLNPAFEQLSQLNQMLDGINSSIQRSVSGLYKLKRLQDPNYRPYYRRHPNQGGNFNNGPRFNNFNDNRNQFNRFNNPRSFNNFNGPNQRFPYQPMGNYQPRNMYQPDGHQMNQYNQMQPYGFNQEPSQPMIPHDVNYTGNLDPTEPNAFVNQESSNSQRPNVNHQNSNSNRSNVKKEAEDSSSSEEDNESEEEEDSEEDEVKPNIAKVNNVLPTSTSVPTKAQSINPVVNIKKENEQPTAGTPGLNKPTHIRFNVQSSSSSSEEETSDEDTADKIVSKENVANKEEVNKENEQESEEESSDEEETKVVSKGIVHENSNNESKGEIARNKEEVNKENVHESEEDSSEEDSGKDSSSDDASDENMDTDNNNEPASNETMFAVSFKKRTHIRFNIEDSDDETADNADKVSKDNDKAQKVEGTHQKVQGTQLQGELLNGDINADKQGNTTDEELERENEKLIIFHSEIITPEQRSQFLNNFSNNPVDILNYIYSRILSNQRIKLIDRKIKRCFPAKTDTRRLLLQKVLKKERDSLKKRRYNVRKRLLRRALRKGNCKTYVGTVLKAPPIVSSDSDEDMKGEAEEKEDSSNTGDKSDKKQSNNSFDIRDKADNLLNTVSPEGETNEKVSDKIDPCDRKDNEEILSQTKPDRSSPSAIVTNNSECKDSEKLDELKTSNKENVPNDCDMKRSSPSNEDKLPMPSEINKTSTEVDAKIHETSTEADENVKASNATEDSKTSTSTLDNASENSSDLVESSDENSQAPSSTLEITQSSEKTSNLSKDDLETSKNSASNLSNDAIVPNSSLENIQTDVSSKNKTDLDTPSEPIESDNSSHKLEENVRNDKEVVQSDIVDAQSDKVVAQNDKLVAQNDKVDGQIDKVAPRPDETVENETNSMEVDETESTIHTESKDRSNSEHSKTGELSDDVNKSEETLEEKETQSLLNDEECSTYASLYKKLDIFKKLSPQDIGDEVPMKISFDVYCSTAKNFSKTKRGAPNYRVIVVQPDQELPSPGQMSELLSRYRDTHSVPYLFAVVLPGAISLYRYADVFIPTLLENLD